MEVTMLVTQALDERDLLLKKIRQRIDDAGFVDFKKENEEKVARRNMSAEEFSQQAQRSYQQIMDMIKRYGKIDAAIVESNANTKIMTSYGEYTVAAAISLRNRMRGKQKNISSFLGQNSYHEDDENQQADFESWILKRIEQEYVRAWDGAAEKNKNLETTAESMRLSILGKDNKGRDDGKTLEVVDAYIKQNKASLVDPLKAEALMAELKLRRETLLAQLETQIKVSNATTTITID